MGKGGQSRQHQADLITPQAHVCKGSFASLPHAQDVRSSPKPDMTRRSAKCQLQTFDSSFVRAEKRSHLLHIELIVSEAKDYPGAHRPMTAYPKCQRCLREHRLGMRQG